jgi:hypothetical protein
MDCEKRVEADFVGRQNNASVSVAFLKFAAHDVMESYEFHTQAWPLLMIEVCFNHPQDWQVT